MSAASMSKSESTHLIPWWLVLIQGIVAILLGILLLFRPLATTIFLVQVLGFYWLISGIFSIISIFIDHSMWGWKLFSGVLGIIAGILIIQNPLWSTLLVPAILMIVLGFGGLMIGVAQLIQAFRGGGWGIGILGALSILLGLILLARPFLVTLSLPFVLGIFGIAGGILAIFWAFQVRKLDKAEKAARATAATRAEMPPPAAPALSTPAMEAIQPEVAALPEATRMDAAGLAAVEVSETMEMEAPAKEEMGAAVAMEASEVAETGMEAVQPEASRMAAAGLAAAEAAETMEMEVPAAEEMGAAVAMEASEMAETTVKEVQPSVAGLKSEIAEFLGLEVEDVTKFTAGLEYVEGIGPVYAEKLKAAGIDTLYALLKKGAWPKGRAELAEQSGISGTLLLKWINHVDLYRVKGVGSEYADLLEASGVDTVVELATRNAANLFEKMNAVNAEKNLVRRTPFQSQVEDWVGQAKKLPRVINY